MAIASTTATPALEAGTQASIEALAPARGAIAQATAALRAALNK